MRDCSNNCVLLTLINKNGSHVLTKNRLLTAEYLFLEKFEEIIDFELLNYGIEHPNSCCTCLEVKLTLDITKKEQLEEFLGLPKVTKKELLTKENFCESTLLINKNSIRNFFMDLYRKKLPKFEDYYKPEFYYKGDINLMIYKSLKSGEFEYKILGIRVMELGLSRLM